LILSLIHWNAANRTLIVSWMIAQILIIVLRTALKWQYKKRNRKNPVSCYRVFLVGTFISGAIWGLAGVFLHPENSFFLQMLTIFTIGGMVAGASAVYAPSIAAFFAFSLPAMGPVTAHSFFHNGNYHLYMGIMLLLFLIIMSFTCNRNRKVFESSLILKNENTDLIAYLSKAKAETEQMNQKLIAENKQRKKVEEELEKHKKNLESDIEKRTVELVNSNKELKLEIMERQKAESAFKASEERYRILIENAIVGVLLIQDGKIIFTNSVCSKMCGYEQEEIIDKNFIHFIHPDDHELAINNHRKRLTGEKVEDSYPIRIINKQGETRWFQINAVCMIYDEKQTILTFLNDITQQRHLEVQVMQSEKMASIGQLAAGVAHEINNPVGFVSCNFNTLEGYQKQLSELVTKYKELATFIETHPESSEEVLSRIKEIEQLENKIDIDYVLNDFPLVIKESEDGVNRVKKIVSDLKNYAHPGNEKKQLTDINRNIESTLNMVWNELKYHVEVVKELNEIPAIECYPQLLNQVFMNLIVNASQAIEDKGTIRIKTNRYNNHIKISISDTGIGIPKDNLTKIFDPFFTTKDVGKGTGLGLHVCYNIVNKHHGTINVDSEAGKGTTFTINLPVSASN
ncbi:MAG: ATP-binding protein, partial [Desulfobacteraceae bacterium]